jgi:hypothetical protein
MGWIHLGVIALVAGFKGSGVEVRQDAFRDGGWVSRVGVGHVELGCMVAGVSRGARSSSDGSEKGSRAACEPRSTLARERGAASGGCICRRAQSARCGVGRDRWTGVRHEPSRAPRGIFRRVLDGNEVTCGTLPEGVGRLLFPSSAGLASIVDT